MPTGNPNELRPCPFCGGSGDLVIYRVAEDAMGCHVKCTSCNARTDEFEDAYTPSADALGAWNTRAEDTSGLLQQMREMSQAFAAMRNDLNEIFPIQSDEADLLEGPEFSVACAAIVEAARTWVAEKDKKAAELQESIDWAHDTLIEINPSNYSHDDVCRLNDASVEVILGLPRVDPGTQEAQTANERQDSSEERQHSAEPAEQIVVGVEITYRNWRGEVSQRTITPKSVWFGSTEWHPEPQWLLNAYDHGKGADRDFAMKDINGYYCDPEPVPGLFVTSAKVGMSDAMLSPWPPESRVREMATDEEIARVIGVNIPTPYALDAVWRQTDDGAVFDLSHADDDSREQWLILSRAVRSALAQGADDES